MRKRRRILWALGVMALLIGAVAVYLYVTPPDPFQVNLNQIQAGMSIAEVEAILGPPDWLGEAGLSTDPLVRRIAMWKHDDAAGLVCMDSSDVVRSKQYAHSWPIIGAVR